MLPDVLGPSELAARRRFAPSVAAPGGPAVDAPSATGQASRVQLSTCMQKRLRAYGEPG